MLHYAPDIDWGIILSEAYLDMIPFNCFYNGTEMAFSTGFCVENCPASMSYSECCVMLIYQ